MLNKIKTFMWLWIFILAFFTPPVAYAKSEYHSFVDEMVNDPHVFEEDPTDEFLAEKREINQLFIQAYKQKKDKDFFYEILVKLNNLFSLEKDIYSESYGNADLLFAKAKLFSLAVDQVLDETFPVIFSKMNEESLKQNLKYENTWKALDETIISELAKESGLTPEMRFKLDRRYVSLSEDILGESAPMTSKNTLRLIEDYSVLGDSKTALAMAHDLLPKIKNEFGEKSLETASILELMSNDYKVLGNYDRSEECLLRAIEINKELYGEETSPKLLSNIIDLITLRRVVISKHHPLYKDMEKAAKNIPEDDLYKLGYSRIMWLIDPEKDHKDPKDRFKRGYQIQTERLKKIYTKSSNLVDTDFRKDAELEFELSNDLRKLTLEYNDINEWDLLAFEFCKNFLGNNHHKTLVKLCDLSDDYLAINKLDDALELAKNALTTSQKIYGDEHPCTVYAIHTLTNVYRKMGLYSEALNLDQQAYDICQKMFVQISVGNGSLEILTAMEDISNDYMGLKDYESAIKYSEELFSKYESPITYFESSYYRSELRKNLTYLYNISGNYEKTVALYGFLNENNKVKPVEEIFSRDSLADCESAFILSDALAHTGKIEDAKYFYFQSMMMYESLRSPNTNLQDQVKNKLFADADSHYKKVASFLVDSETSGKAKSELFESNVPYYKMGLSFYVERKYVTALMAVEFCKARNLTEKYSEQLALSRGGLSENELLKLNEYKSKISQFQDKITASKSYNLKLNFRLAQLSNIKAQAAYKEYLQEKYPQYKHPYEGFFKNFDQKMFNANTALFALTEYIVPKNDCYISFSIVKKEDTLYKQSNEILALATDKNGEVKGLIIPVDDNFLNSCNVYHELLAYPNIDSMKRDSKYLWKLPNGGYKIMTTRQSPAPNAIIVNNSKDLADIRQELSSQLGNTLLAPLSNYISSKPNWIISPDGELNNIPFETLQFNGKMAIESANICYVPSLAVLALMKEMGEKNSKLQNRNDIFAMGNAVYGNNDYAESRGLQIEFLEDIKRSSDDYVDLTKLKWANLPGTGEELKKVSTLFSTNSQEIVAGIDASERNLKQRDKSGQLSQYKYLLFATHGLFMPTKPEYCSIVLSQGLDDENYDGYVTIGEWFGYNLNSDLVYLSACESGLGDYQAGEGIIGLPYALTVAGNKDTVMSLWKIDDEAAAEFASVFFSKLKDGKTEVQALNETKREFLSSTNPKFNTPSTWAAFLLYGI